MNDIICPNCGKSSPPEAEFCGNCFTSFQKNEPGAEESPAESQPDWLQKIRERSQTEKPNTPPLGEFGAAEERPFRDSETPGEIPDWLKELQKTEISNPEVPAEPAGDWMSRLHEILPGSENKTPGQSTTFYSDEELSAMAAAARKLDSYIMDPPEQATTQPVGALQDSSPSDFAYEPSSRFDDPTAFDSPSFGQPETDSPGSMDQQTSSAESTGVKSDEPEPGFPPARLEDKPDDSVPWMQTFESPAASEQPIQLFEPDEKRKKESQPVKPAEEPPLYIPPEPKPEELESDKEIAPLSSFFGQRDSVAAEEPSNEKPEQLIPEGVLQPQYNRPVEFSGRLDISDSQRANIDLLKNMLVGEIQPPTPVSPLSKISGRTLRLFIGITLLVVMIFPLVTGYALTGEQALFSPGVVAMHSAVAALPENASFLIITDFEPAFAGEMKAASIGVLDNLMMKGMNFSILSTVPTGPALARDLITSVRPESFGYQPEKIAYLGYLPGGTTGMQDFVRAPRQAMPLLDSGRYAWTYPASQAVNAIQDYAGILIITENTETGRAWIEQLHGVMADKPLLMVVSAQSAPLMRPYLDSDQLSGLIGGRVEGAMYDRIMESPPRSPAVSASYQAGMLAAAALILLGGLYGILQGLFNRRPLSPMEDRHVG